MNLVELSPKSHDLHRVSYLIYETDPSYFKMIFGPDKKKTAKKIKRLVELGANRFGYEYIKIAIENNQIFGLIIGHNSDDLNKLRNNEVNISNLKIYSIFDIVRLFILKKLLLQKILTEKPSPGEFYINNISVLDGQRSKGIGSFIINKILDDAREKRYNRVFVNVSMHNNRAINFFEKNGFKVYDKKVTRFKFKQVHVCYMEHLL